MVKITSGAENCPAARRPTAGHRTPRLPAQRLGERPRHRPPQIRTRRGRGRLRHRDHRRTARCGHRAGLLRDPAHLEGATGDTSHVRGRHPHHSGSRTPPPKTQPARAAAAAKPPAVDRMSGCSEIRPTVSGHAIWGSQNGMIASISDQSAGFIPFLSDEQVIPLLRGLATPWPYPCASPSRTGHDVRVPHHLPMPSVPGLLEVAHDASGSIRGPRLTSRPRWRRPPW